MVGQEMDGGRGEYQAAGERDEGKRDGMEGGWLDKRWVEGGVNSKLPGREMRARGMEWRGDGWTRDGWREG